MKPRKNYLKYAVLGTIACLCTALLSFIIIEKEFSNDVPGDGKIYEFTLAKKGNMIDNATFYAWIPQNVGTIRSVIVHQHGCTREDDAHQMMYDIQWRELARKYHSILIAPKFITGSKCGNWCQPSNGSDGVFLSMLDTLALKANHPEIKTIPWALWGHSGGAGWVTYMAGKYPQRVATMIVQACGSDISDVPAALKIPVLHHNGTMDLCYQNAALFAKGRRKGAYWAHAVNPVVSSAMDGHMVHDLRMLAIPWMDACLEMRLPLKAGESTLRDMDATKAWLGDTAKRTVAPAAAFKGDKYAACWFPNQTLAEKWVEYMATGTVTDKTPPPAPYNLAATYADNKVTLKWKASPDLESGLRTFIIYRDGKELQTLAYTAKKESDKQSGYQAWNNGDNPVPIPAPDMVFTDTNLDGKSTHTYEVSTVNWSNKPSKKSAPFVLKGGK